MKNHRWDKKEEDNAAEKGTNEGVRVFYPGPICFIYKHVLMGFWRGTNEIYFWVFKCRWYRRINVSRKKIRTKKEKREQGIRKYLSRSTSSPHLRLGGLRHMKGRATERVNNVDKYHKKNYMEQVYLFP
jgi:hypothetical protein